MNKLSPEMQELYDRTMVTIERLENVAGKILPKGDKNQTETERLIRASVPDTYEWFEMKFNLIYEAENALEFYKLLKEWQEYISERAERFIDFQKQIIAQVKGKESHEYIHMPTS